MTISKTTLWVTLAALAAAAVPAAAQPRPRPIRGAVREAPEAVRLYRQNRETQTDRQTKTVKLGADGELALSNIAGDIVVTKGGGSEATVEIVKTARGRTADDAKQMLGLVDVAITERSGRAEVKTVYPHGDENSRDRRRNLDVSVAYTVTAPSGTRLTVGSISGSVRVEGIKGDLSVNSVSGAVRIAGAGRVSAAKSVSGSVEVSDTQVDGGIELQSVSGDVVLRKVTARRVEAGTVSGRVVIEDVQAERIEGHTVSGNVDYSGTLAKGGRYELTSHSGDMRLAVAGATGFELEATSFSGSLRSDLPLKTSDRDSDDTRGRRRSLRGIYGDGSAVITVTTFSGNVVLSKR
jgi:putative adhesin